MQQRSEKTAEPSMEDILASIRKIISEDPAIPSKPVEPKVAEHAPVRPQVAASVMPAVPAPPLPTAMSPPPRPAAAAAPSSRLSDFMRELAPSAVPLSAAGPAAFHDDLADLVETGSGDTEPDDIAPVAAAPEFVRRPAAKSEPITPVAPTPVVPPVVELPAIEPVTAEPETRPSTPAPDFGAFVPQAMDSIRSVAPRAIPLSLSPEFRTPDAVATMSPSRPAAPELVLPRTLSASPENAVAATSDAGTLGTASTTDADAAAQSALGALAMGFAAPTAVAVSSAAPAAVDTGSMLGRRSLDDAVVDMIRPMVRDWLDANLPGMVEKAMQTELAARGNALR
jgi:uncharacterized protein